MMHSSRWASLALECLIGGAVVAVGVFALLEPTSTRRAHLTTRIETIEARIASGCSKIAELEGVSSEIERLRARLGKLDAQISTIEAPDRMARAIRDAAIEEGLVIVSDTAWTRVEPETDEPEDEEHARESADGPATRDGASSAGEIEVVQRSMHVVGSFDSIGRFVDWIESRDAAIDVRWIEMHAARDHGENDRRLTARLRVQWSRWTDLAEEGA